MSELSEQLQKLISKFKLSAEDSEIKPEPAQAEKKSGLLSKLIHN
jgi:hypothetical protein